MKAFCTLIVSSLVNDGGSAAAVDLSSPFSVKKSFQSGINQTFACFLCSMQSSLRPVSSAAARPFALAAGSAAVAAGQAGTKQTTKEQTQSRAFCCHYASPPTVLGGRGGLSPQPTFSPQPRNSSSHFTYCLLGGSGGPKATAGISNFVRVKRLFAHQIIMSSVGCHATCSARARTHSSTPFKIRLSIIS